MPTACRAAVVGGTAGALALVLALGGCGDDDGDDAEATVPATDPLPEVIGPVIVTEPSEDPEYLERVLADGEVTASELTAAYETYLQCIADGGGYGRYAYDVELRVPLTLDWRMAGDDALGSGSASLDAGCSHDYLGDLVLRFENSHDAPDDLAARQRESIVECVEAVDPDAAAAIPDELTTDTLDDGLYVGDVQHDATFLNDELVDSTDPADEEAAAAIGDCFLALGATWHSFGEEPPAGSEPPASVPNDSVPVEPSTPPTSAS